MESRNSYWKLKVLAKLRFKCARGTYPEPKNDPSRFLEECHRRSLVTKPCAEETAGLGITGRSVKIGCEFAGHLGKRWCTIW